MRRNKAFTLIELLIVIAIIGILATLIIVFLGDANRRSKDASIKSNASSIKTALERYKTENNSYPKSGSVPIETLVTNYLSSYFTAGASSSVSKHPINTDALYRHSGSLNVNCPIVGSCYIQGWTLLSQSDVAYAGPVIGSNGLGNGVYYVCKGSNDPYTGWNLSPGPPGPGNYGCFTGGYAPIIRGMGFIALTDTVASRIFLTYGPL